LEATPHAPRALAEPGLGAMAKRGVLLRPPPPRGLHALVTLWPRLMLFVAGFVLILGTLELSLQPYTHKAVAAARFNQRQPAPYVEFRPQPNVSVQTPGFHVTTNELGFRADPIPPVKPEGEYRIFFLSSSVGFNGSRNDTTIAGYLEHVLRERLPEANGTVRVINASGESYNTRQSLALLLMTVIDYDPDLIVVFQGTDSLMYPATYESRPGYPFNFETRAQLMEALRTHTDSVGLWARMLDQSAIVRWFHPKLVANAKQRALLENAHVVTFTAVEQYEPYIRETVRDFRKMAMLAESVDCPILIGLPPLRHPAVLPGAVDRLAAATRALCSERSNARYVDTLAAMEELDRAHAWHHDQLHWNDEGNRIMAEFIAEALTHERDSRLARLLPGR